MALAGPPKQRPCALDRPAIRGVVPVQKASAVRNRPSSRHRPPLNPHRARRTPTAPPLATSCVGASPTPAYSARGDGIATGVRETFTVPAAIPLVPSTSIDWKMALAGPPKRRPCALDRPAIRGVVPVQKASAVRNRPSSRHRPPLNPHRARRTPTAPPLATSCVGASPTPAYSARGDGIATGVRETFTVVEGAGPRQVRAVGHQRILAPARRAARSAALVNSEGTGPRCQDRLRQTETRGMLGLVSGTG